MVLQSTWSFSDEGDTVDDDQGQNIVQRIISWRVSAAMEPQPPNETVLKLQQPLSLIHI